MRTVFRSAQITLLSVLLAGCVTGLGPQRTTFTQEMALKQVPANWAQTAPKNTQALSSLQALSNNKLLGRHVESVLKNNISLRQSVIDLRRSQLEQSKASGALLPTLTLNGSGNRQRQNTPQGRTYTTAYNGSATINWEVDLWGKLSDRSRAAEQTAAARQHDLQAARTSLAAQAMRNWVQLTALNRLVTLDKSRIESLKRTEQIITDQFSGGIGQLSDLEAARSATANAQAALADRMLQVDRLKRQMQVDASQVPNAHFKTGKNIPVIRLPKGALPATILGRRPDLLAAFARATAADSQYSASYKELLPTFSINLNASDQAGRLSDLFNGGPAWRLLGSLSAPIFDGGNRRLTAKQADLDAARLWLSYRQTVLNALLEVENGMQSEKTLSKRERILTKAYKHSQNNYEQYKRRYQDGLTDIVTLLSAERDAFAAHQALVNVRNNRMQNRINLAVAFGIGL